MNIFNLVVDSIKKRGLTRTIQIILSNLGDYWFDIKYGTNTTRWVNLNDLEVRSENKQRGMKYQPTFERPFRKLMNIVDFPSDSVFVDLGCGKGRVLMMASEYGFKRIVGVEFSRELCEDATRNLSIYRKKVGVDVDVDIVELDVVDYEIKDDENVFFMFNPFDEVVLNKVLTHINMSLEKRDRKIWLIYYNPLCGDIIEKQGNLEKAGEYIFGGMEFIVYVSNSSNDLLKK